jgi:hypothetical protein
VVDVKTANQRSAEALMVRRNIAIDTDAGELIALTSLKMAVRNLHPMSKIKRITLYDGV